MVKMHLIFLFAQSKENRAQEDKKTKKKIERLATVICIETFR